MSTVHGTQILLLKARNVKTMYRHIKLARVKTSLCIIYYWNVSKQWMKMSFDIWQILLVLIILKSFDFC